MSSIYATIMISNAEILIMNETDDDNFVPSILCAEPTLLHLMQEGVDEENNE